MSEEKKISGYVPKTFKDDGTKEIFAGGKSHEFSPGAYRNYRAAGKITDAPAAKTDNAPVTDAPKGKTATA